MKNFGEDTKCLSLFVRALARQTTDTIVMHLSSDSGKPTDVDDARKNYGVRLTLDENSFNIRKEKNKYIISIILAKVKIRVLSKSGGGVKINPSYKGKPYIDAFELDTVTGSIVFFDTDEEEGKPLIRNKLEAFPGGATIDFRDIDSFITTFADEAFKGKTIVCISNLIGEVADEI